MHHSSLQHEFRQTGLSLIELMIAMLVGLILIAGVLSIFISSRQSYGINDAVGQIQENGRFALDFIRTATRKAGYMGCATSALTTSYLNPAADSMPYDFTTAINGYIFTAAAPAPTENPAADPSAADWSPNLDAYLTGKVLPNTDVLVVRFTQNNPMYITNISSSSAVNMTVSGSVAGVNSLAPGDLMLISNCASAIVMQTTAPTAGTLISHAGAGSPGNADTGVPTSYIGAQVVSPNTDAFYIGQGADGSPALYAASFVGGVFTSQELVPGVESMRVLYGVDTTGSQVPSQYETADQVDATGLWNNVVSVRVGLLLRSTTGAVPLPAVAPSYTLLDSTTAFTAPRDTRLRQIFIATIGLRNNLP
jgi:type IV pilus assembly protein PilW